VVYVPHNTVLSVWGPWGCGEFLDTLTNCPLVRSDSAPWSYLFMVSVTTQFRIYGVECKGGGNGRRKTTKALTQINRSPGLDLKPVTQILNTVARLRLEACDPDTKHRDCLLACDIR
jgi:hypothetical protein